MLLHPHPQPEHEIGDPGHGNNYSTPIGLAPRISVSPLPGYGVLKHTPLFSAPILCGSHSLPTLSHFLFSIQDNKFNLYLDIYAH